MAAARRQRSGRRQPRLLVRQLRPVRAWLGAPAVYVPTFVRTHVQVRVRAGSDPGAGRVTVELWNHPSGAERKLLWVERAAIMRRTPGQPGSDTGPVLVARHELPDRRTADEPTRRGAE
jgi:hypothetical protein